YAEEKDKSIKVDVSTTKRQYAITENLHIQGSLAIGSFLTNVLMSATIFAPNGQELGTVSLYDDGTHGDLFPNDGDYANNDFSSYTMAGTYKIQLNAHALADTAFFAYKGPGQNLPETGLPDTLRTEVKRIASVSVIVGDPEADEEIIEIGNCQLLNGGTGAQAMNGVPFTTDIQTGDKIFVTADGSEYAVPVTQINNPWWVGFWQYRYLGAGTSNGSCSILRNSSVGSSSFQCTGDCLNAIEMTGQSATLNTTGEVWYKVTSSISGWQASEVQGRTIYVNGEEVQAGEFPLPESVNGTYYFRFTEGEHSWASWSLW
ncbi:MAG TPA: hypothetical protein VLM37_01580, partial [Fibrobacteraceae bacterium]|nr:hypothetical protein [Fibrobacteraceae bacterium]